jgi:sterol desaturase/sphingolipid hydroxylase (fatty acid hydroxylase superfamily)
MKNNQSIRIFKNDFLESLTHVHPVVPLVLWTPVITFFFWRNITEFQTSLGTLTAVFVAGLMVWTFMEYVLHRYVFHFPAKSKLGKRLVFLFHGLHHDDPNDATRLVMPPAPAILFAVMFYQFFALIVSASHLDSFFASFMIGYLLYDYIHYATHHFRMTSKGMRFLKTYHLKHHHGDSKLRYGVSNPLWDIIFGTYPPKN